MLSDRPLNNTHGDSPFMVDANLIYIKKIVFMGIKKDNKP